MKNHLICFSCILFIVLIIWCDPTKAKLKSVKELKNIIESEDFLQPRGLGTYNNNRRKRQNENETAETGGEGESELAVLAANFTFPPEMCELLGDTCGKLPIYQDQCLIMCNFPGSKIAPFLRLIPFTSELTCQTSNTALTEMPKFISEHKEKFDNIKSILSAFAVKKGSEGSFAMVGANSLVLTIIKNIQGEDLDELKPIIAKLELHDAEKEAGPVAPVNPPTITFDSVRGGLQVTSNCDKSKLQDETYVLAQAFDKRPCLLDLLMPGYFVFSRAPAVASTRIIAPLLRAWNIPLFLFTGVTCCMSRFAIEKKVYECVNKQTYLDQPHGITTEEGPPASSVCGTIPQYKYVDRKAKNATTGNICQEKGLQKKDSFDEEVNYDGDEEELVARLCQPSTPKPDVDLVDYSDGGGSKNATEGGDDTNLDAEYTDWSGEDEL